MIPCFSLEKNTGEEMGDISVFVYQELGAFSSLAMDACVIRPRDGVGVENNGMGRVPIMDAILRDKMDAPAFVAADAAGIVFADHVVLAVQFEEVEVL